MSKKKLLAIFFTLSFVALMPFATKAFSVKSGESVFTPKDQIIDGNLYAAGSTITIDGQVTGDVVCAAQTVNISAKVDGDVICAAQTINITGDVLGNVRVAGNFINLSGTVGRNMNAFGASVIMSEKGKIGWDLLVAGVQTEIRGQIDGNLHGSAKYMTMAGKVAKNLDIRIDSNLEKKDQGRLEIIDTGSVGGDVIYTGVNEAKLVKEKVRGRIIHNLPEGSNNKMFLAFVWGRIYAIFSALLVGLVLLSLWRKQLVVITDKMWHKVGVKIGFGAIIMLLTPIVALLLAFTFIGIPLALVLMALWLVALFVARVIFGIMVGRFIMKKIAHKETHRLLLEMTIGVVACAIVFALPFLGWLAGMVAIWWVLGSLWQQYQKR